MLERDAQAIEREDRRADPGGVFRFGRQPVDLHLTDDGDPGHGLFALAHVPGRLRGRVARQRRGMSAGVGDDEDDQRLSQRGAAELRVPVGLGFDQIDDGRLRQPAQTGDELPWAAGPVPPPPACRRSARRSRGVRAERSAADARSPGPESACCWPPASIRSDIRSGRARSWRFAAVRWFRRRSARARRRSRVSRRRRTAV